MPTEAGRKAVRGGAINIGVKLGGAGLAFALNILLARTMSVEGFAQVSVAFAWLAVLTIAGTLSMPLLMVRFAGDHLQSGRADLARGVVRFGVLAATGAAVLLTALGAALLAFGPADLAGAARPVAWLVLLLLLPTVMLGLGTGVLQAFQHAVAAEALNSLLRPLLVGATVLAAWAVLGEHVAAHQVLFVHLGVTLFLLAVAAVLAWRAQHGALGRAPAAFAVREWSTAAAGLLLVLVMAGFAERLDLFLLAARAPTEEVAPYAVAQRFAQTVLLAINAVAAVMAPQFAAALPALRAGQGEAAESIARSAGRLAFAACAGAWLVFALAGPWLVLLFGPAYAGAHLPLVVLVGGQVVACLFGPALLLATLTGHSRLAVLALAVGMAANAAVNWLAVPHWGGLGAALGGAVGAVVTAAVAHRLVTRRIAIAISVLPAGGWRPWSAAGRSA